MDHSILLLSFVVVLLDGFHFLAIVLRMLLPVLLNRATPAVSSRPFPSLQVGACIVNAENKIVGIGYNGMPNGCSDDALPWRRTAESKLDTKYPYVCHAELNAIMNKNSADVKGCSMYVALFPCNECAKLIIQSGIKEVIFMSDKYHDSEETTAARLMFDMAGVTFRQFMPKCSKIVIDFDSINSQKLL